jgi:hypothetical protein
MSRKKTGRVHVLIARTVRLREYESIRLEYGEVVDVGPGDSFDAVRDRAIREVTEVVDEMANVAKEMYSDDRS